MILTNLTNLRWLSLSGLPLVADAEISLLAKTTSLRSLYLNRTGICTVPALPQLMVLTMNHCVSLLHLNQVSLLTNLRLLELNSNKHLSGRAFTILSRLPLLEDLSVAGTGISGTGLVAMAKRRVPLRRLDLVSSLRSTGAPGTVSDIVKSLRMFPLLKTLVIGGSHFITTEHLQQLLSQVQLNTLALWRLPVSFTADVINKLVRTQPTLTHLLVIHCEAYMNESLPRLLYDLPLKLTYSQEW